MDINFWLGLASVLISLVSVGISYKILCKIKIHIDSSSKTNVNAKNGSSAAGRDINNHGK